MCNENKDTARKEESHAEVTDSQRRNSGGISHGWRYFLISAFTFSFAIATDFCIAEAVQCSIAAIW